VTLQQIKKCDQAGSAAVRRGFDEKSGERRGDQLKIASKAPACFRKIFAANRTAVSPHRSDGIFN
jgi:hypothetical protein